ncbi:FYVE zinc finger-domain-containing protein [Butyriboletus roseoflavus]|nr:FYVE zinc finger-domain-containing protein [Butyriboletus roseoflavus]
MQNNASAVPYQAYRSKRHSRTVSTFPIPPNVPPPSSHRPLSGDWVIEKLPSDLVLVQPMNELFSPTSAATPPPAVDGMQLDSPSPSASSAPLPLTSTAPRKSSTFRRLQPRPSASRALPSSPLRPPAAQSRAPSSSSSISRQLDLSPPPPRSPPLHSRVPSISDDKSHPNRPSPSHTPNASLAIPSESSGLPPPRSTSLSVPSTSVSSSTSPSPITSPPLSASSLPSTPLRSSTPYRPGFQPRGVYRPRTDEFSQARKAKHDATRIERTKLERRLEKLIHFHFPVQATESKDVNKPSVERRRSGFFDLDFASLKNMDATEIWKGVLQSQALQGAKGDIRAAEQRIAPWQQDAAVSKCPLCTASFHPLTNRKHHCRLCGQIICSLPVKRPQRTEPCSILFVVDSRTRQIEQVGEGVDYGVKRRASGAGTGNGSSKEKDKDETLADDEKFLKGVRVCGNCKPVLSREQFHQEVSRIPPLVRLYEVFVDLEREIEEALPQFQELLLTLTSNSPPSKEAAAARKRILDDFASYDAISKRIRKIPCTVGSSQDRVQLAIRTRADLFLQKNMFPLQSLPKAKKQTSSPDAATPLVDPDSELAHALQPLLEQEALLESFVGEAMAHRKFEDAKTLKTNLKEIRAEIDRMVENRVGNGST